MLAKLTNLAAMREPFLFFTDFEAKKFQVFTPDELEKNDIEFSINEDFIYRSHAIKLTKKPLPFPIYKEKFDVVIKNIQAGNSYLLNLTMPTPIQCKESLQKIYKHANAPFKLRYKEEFVCFSPERFITIEDDIIATFPMKGTIDAAVANAKEKILQNKKEMAEHVMIVDLLRNDLGIIASDVKVEKFRFIQTIEAGEKRLLHVSSKITAKLQPDWQANLAHILVSLLPAGSISGTPKRKTLQLIKQIENYNRGYFSGVFGFFDGVSLHSAVMIRFIEKKDGKLTYKSGGGITLDSDAKLEYNELLDKIYIP